MAVYCLLIEGDDARVEVAKKRIERFNEVFVTVASNLDEALKSIESLDTPDFDLVMVDFDNIDVQGVKKIRAKTDAAIIGFNNSDDELMGAEALKMGADDFLPTRKHSDNAIFDSIMSSINRKNIRKISKKIQSKLMLLTTAAGVW